MNDISEKGQRHCDEFLDKLDLWLAGELEPVQHHAMQAHEEGCSACRLEARLAREIDSITRALPELESQLSPHVPHPGNDPGRETLLSRLLRAWRQPLVFVPALALMLAAVLLSPRLGESTAEPQTVMVDGREYTEDEIIKAAQDLELALRYLDKYGSYPARVVSAELKQSHLPLPPAQEQEEDPSI